MSGIDRRYAQKLAAIRDGKNVQTYPANIPAAEATDPDSVEARYRLKKLALAAPAPAAVVAPVAAPANEPTAEPPEAPTAPRGKQR